MNISDGNKKDSAITESHPINVHQNTSIISREEDAIIIHYLKKFYNIDSYPPPCENKFVEEYK